MTKRCPWAGEHPPMSTYHDKEWGVPSRDDRYLFELLTLEGAQAGLSWSIVLNKREGYQQAFYQFDIKKCAQLTDEELFSIKEEGNIIKHLGKIQSVRKNAQAILTIQQEHGNFSDFLWGYVEDTPIINNWESISDVPTQSKLSVQLSKDLKRRGFTFVGPVILYSYLQAVGIINDHLISCPFHPSNQYK